MNIKNLLLFMMCLALGILLIGSNHADSTNDDKTIVVGGKDFTEQEILVEIIAQLIEENTDLIVERKTGFNAAGIHQAIVDKEIDLYPEYTSTAWINVLKQAPIGFSDILFREVKNKYLKDYDIKWLERYGFNNSYGLAMKKEVANDLGIESYSDLRLKGNNLVIGGEEDFFIREDTYPALVNTYGINFKDTKVLDLKEKYEALKTGDVDVIDIYTTDSFLDEYDFKILFDDLNFFTPYDAATVVRVETLEKFPELEKLLNQLGGQISDEEMSRLNYLVDKGNMSASEVARLFLKSKGLIP